MQNNSNFTIVIIAGILSAALYACTNSLVSQSTINAQVISALASPSTTATTSVDNEVVANVTIGGLSSNTVSASPSPTATASGAAPLTSLFFDTTKSSVPIINHCNVVATGAAAVSKPCACTFNWSEINTTSGNSVTIPRQVQTAATAVQPYLVSCNAPEVYSSIPTGTQITISVIGTSANGDAGLFKVQNYVYTKAVNVSGGSFQDFLGNSFNNIFHYSCYEKFQRGMAVQSKSLIKTNPNTGNPTAAMIATQFCVANASAGAGAQASASCPNLPPANYSSQASYFNFYIQNSELGDINQFNGGYVCPVVQETLNSNGTIGTSFNVWPLDSNFALALSYSTAYPIGVVANSKLGLQGDPTAVSNTCFSGAVGASTTPAAVNTNGPVTSCIGYAAPVNADGATCPTITNSSGQLVRTYRLRRYIALYPRLYDSNGNTLSNRTQGLDTVYVLDRPVNSPNGTITSATSPGYSMLGPKPCPYAFFDQMKVTGPFSGYVATSNSSWNNKNVDGVELPNFDSDTISCSTALPFLSPDKSTFYIATINKFATSAQAIPHKYIRPIQSFFSHYEEDTNFKACAPQANPFSDPPLHFSRDTVTGNVAWCAESYPTQNTNLSNVDPAVSPTPIPGTSVTPLYGSGLISNYTSHQSYNSLSATCAATVPSSSLGQTSTSYRYYPNVGANLGYAFHSSNTTWAAGTYQSGTANKTCDRTASTAGLAWPLYPLLAPAPDMEAAISTDSSYYCTVTYDASSGKQGKFTPSDGCCARSAVGVQTGFIGVTGPSGQAHLEPTTACGIPSY